MTRAEFISRLADRLGHLPADEVKAAVLAITDRLGLALQNGDRVEIRGFGGFSLHNWTVHLGVIKHGGRPFRFLNFNPVSIPAASNRPRLGKASSPAHTGEMRC